jgi:ribosomal protein S18 acetylase RimI-like enzyme
MKAHTSTGDRVQIGGLCHQVQPTARAIRERLSANSALMRVFAAQEGRAVGFGSGTVLDHPDKPRALLVQELGVNAEARRQGIARALIAALRAAGRQRGCRVTWVLTEEDNIAARAAYAAAGGREMTGVVMVEWDELASLSDLSHDQPLRPPAPDG